MAANAEAIKRDSRGLRGPLAEELAVPAGKDGLSEASYTLLKFHGTYEQHDRDTATARKQVGLSRDWSFMVRVRAPAGRLTAAQWLALDDLAGSHADGTLRLTSRQGVQFHGVIQENLRPTIAGIHSALMTTLAACGDVVRNVITTPAPRADPVHTRLVAEARRLSDALLPRSRGHHEIFLGEERVAGVEEDPLYGTTYLPRKFKIALVHPDDNSADVLANDLGFVMVPEGWIVTLGGGMGMTHNKPATFPRLADPVALIGRTRCWRWPRPPCGLAPRSWRPQRPQACPAEIRCCMSAARRGRARRSRPIWGGSWRFRRRCRVSPVPGIWAGHAQGGRGAGGWGCRCRRGGSPGGGGRRCARWWGASGPIRWRRRSRTCG
jgi:hypothetical protein